jgi:putative membrane protein
MTPPTGMTNELAKGRNRAAAERTLTSWIQNCLSLIGFGITFDRIFVALGRALPKNHPIVNARLATAIGLSAIGIGIFLLVLAIISYLIQVRSLDLKDYLSKPIHSRYLLVVVCAVILFGLVALAIVFSFGM